MKVSSKFLISMMFSLMPIAAFAQESSAAEPAKADLPPQTRGIVVLPGFQVLQSDLAVTERRDPSGSRIGLDLYVRKNTEVQSVMLVETTKDPEGKEPNYSYRASEWNETNGDEIRYLDGKELHSDFSRYSLISSTVVSHPKLGDSFHIFIPNTIEYGYEWSRHGTVTIGKGTFINIRTFEKKYGDYTGRYMDNPFMFDFPAPPEVEEYYPDEKDEEPEELPPAEEMEVSLIDGYNSLAAEKFAELASDGKGLMIYSKGPETIAEDLIQAVDDISSRKADVVFAIDTTGSMKDDLETLKSRWIPQFLDQVKSFKDMRIGLILYRDYNDNYNYKGLPVKYFDFTKNPANFVKCLNTAIIKGNEGGDVPEAVYEALYASLQFYDWRKDPAVEKKIILIGDAEPHPAPRGVKKISQETVMKIALEKNIKLDCIIVPDNKK